MKDPLQQLTRPRFYFVDERLEDGDPMLGTVNADAHADLIVSLLRRAGDILRYASLVMGRSYLSLPNKRSRR